MIKRLAFGEGADDDGHKGNTEEDANGAQLKLVALLPKSKRQALKKLAYGELCCPDAVRLGRMGQSCSYALVRAGGIVDETYNMA